MKPDVYKIHVFIYTYIGTEIEGIFRRSANASTVKTVQKKFNAGEPVNFRDHDIHVPAVILKTFLRELPEPILTYDLYDAVIRIPCKFHAEICIIIHLKYDYVNCRFWFEWVICLPYVTISHITVS